MKVFLIGLPGSCRTTVAQALCKNGKFNYIDVISFVKSDFRNIGASEDTNQYNEEYHNWLSNKIKLDDKFIYEKISCLTNDNSYYIIDGLFSPKDFIGLFNPNKDIVVFLNRIENDSDHKDYENIGVSVSRDYCFWASSANLLKKEQWLEYNFKAPGEESDKVKILGSKNSVFIIKSINKVISHLENYLVTLLPND